MEKLKPGIYPDIPFKRYNDIGAVRNSYLSKLNVCPAAALLETETTDAMRLGRAIHAYILEGEEAFNESCTVLPEINRRTNAGKAEYAQFELDNIGKELMKPSELEDIKAMKAAVLAHPAAKLILEEGLSEQTVIWKDKDTGLLCKCRPDRSPNPETRTLIDLKSTVNAEQEAFFRSMLKYGYLPQAAFYTDGMNAHRTKFEGFFEDFIFIAVEKKPPYRVEVYLVDNELINYGRSEYKRLLGIEAKCRETGFYPHYQSEGIETIFMPSWMG